jgi:hypothetical protein
MLGYASFLSAVALLLNAIQLPTMLFVPICRRWVSLVNARIGGMLWSLMQRIFQVRLRLAACAHCVNCATCSIQIPALRAYEAIHFNFQSNY